MLDPAPVIEGTLEEQESGELLPGWGLAGLAGPAGRYVYAAGGVLVYASTGKCQQIRTAGGLQVLVEDLVDEAHAPAGAELLVEELASADGDLPTKLIPGEPEGETREDGFDEEVLGVNACAVADTHLSELDAVGGQDGLEEGPLGGGEREPVIGWQWTVISGRLGVAG